MGEVSKRVLKTQKLIIDKRYVMLPQSMHQSRTPYRELITNVSLSSSEFWSLFGCQDRTGELTLKIDGRMLLSQPMEVAQAEPLHWAAIDIAEWMGKTLEITMKAAEGEQAAFDEIHLAEDLTEIPSLYHEPDRPQFHFSYRTGVLGDPTAMVYYPPRQTWHLFTIHNPLRGREICWGHATSRDLLHWEEQAPLFHAPYQIFNGVGFVDTANLLGLNCGGEQAIVLLTPIMGREGGFISMTVSVDGGETFHDMNDLKADLARSALPTNPIVPGWGDAPRIHWNPVAQQFFLSHCRWEGEGDSIFVTSLQYTSTDLVNWTRIDDFPLLIADNFPGEGDANDVIELPLDGNAGNRVVLVMDGRNGYTLGKYAASRLNNLDGKPLSPTDMIATQHCGFPVIFSGAPEGRGIIMYNVGCDRISGIPNFEIEYKPNLSFPLELSVRSTPQGPRLYQNPIPEIENLYGRSHFIGDLRLRGGGVTAIDGPEGGLYRMKAVLQGGTVEAIDLVIMGYTITYHVKNGTLGAERDTQWWPDRQTSTLSGHHAITQNGNAIWIDLLIDRTSIEVFPNDGERFIYYGKLKLYEHQGAHFAFAVRGGEAVIRELIIIEMNWVWLF